MLHHSSSRHQRNRGSKIKTVLQVALLLGVVVWLLYQVKHSYDKKNEYLDDNEDQLAHENRSMFRGRKEKAGNSNDAHVDDHGENLDVPSKTDDVGVDHLTDTFDHQHDEEKSGETVFEKDNTEFHEDDVRNIEKLGAEQGEVGSGNGNIELHTSDGDETTRHIELHTSDGDETTRHTEDAEHNPEFNRAVEQAENGSEVHSTEEDVPHKDDHTREGESTSETDRRSHEEVPHGDESTNADQTHANSNGSGREEAEEKEATDFHTSSRSISDSTKTATTENAQNDASSNGEHVTEALPDETGNIPSIHNEDGEKIAGENQGDASSTTTENTEHMAGEAVRTETGSDAEGTDSSGSDAQNKVIIPVDNEITKRDASESQSDNAMEANASDKNSSEEKTSTESGSQKGSDVSDSEKLHSHGDNAVTEVVSVEPDKSQGASDAKKIANNSSEETKTQDNSNNGVTKSSHNGEQLETRGSANAESSEFRRDGGSESDSSNDNGLEQTGRTETQ